MRRRNQTRIADALAAVLASLVAGLATPPGAVMAQEADERPWLDTAQTPEHRADALVARLGAIDHLSGERVIHGVAHRQEFAGDL